MPRFPNHLPDAGANGARDRQLPLVPIVLAPGQTIQFSTGAHSALTRAVVEEFAPRFAPGAALVYVGDTGDKWSYFDKPRLDALGGCIDGHAKMPDVILHSEAKNWLLLIEAVTSHGPVDSERRAELLSQFVGATAGIVYVSAFPDRPAMARYLGAIAWETEVWVADSPSHMIHFNGERFLGPYGQG